MCTMCYMCCVCLRANVHIWILHIEKYSHLLASLSLFELHVARAFKCVSNEMWRNDESHTQKGEHIHSHKYTYTHVVCKRFLCYCCVFFATPTFCFPISYFLVSGEFFSVAAVIQMFVALFIYLTLFYVGNLLAARHIQNSYIFDCFVISF